MTKNWIFFFIALVQTSAFAAHPVVKPFDLPWMNHEGEQTSYRSSDHPNGIFVVEAYFASCPSCQTNSSQVHELAERYQNFERVQILDVGIDEEDSEYEKWIRLYAGKHPVLKDSERVLIGQLKTKLYPSTYVIDCKGRVVEKTIGVFTPAKKARLHKAIDDLLKEDC